MARTWKDTCDSGHIEREVASSTEEQRAARGCDSDPAQNLLGSERKAVKANRARRRHGS